MRFNSKILLILGLLLILGFTNSKIYRHEKDLVQGKRVVLKLQPRDPRSLMQGDYMVLSYELANRLRPTEDSGFIYLKPGPNALATESSYSPGTGAVKLKYRVHEDRVLFDIESYFFQEGQASKYQVAKYVELRVTEEGVPRIVHLLDENLQVI
jgi:uncharacterized membrane-anchored protein